MTNTNNLDVNDKVVKNFIEEIIDVDLLEGKYSKVHTRFPPEPNGYLHIGHAKSICLNFGLANKYKGKCNLRFDDTNPITEDTEYVDSIKEDVEWLGFKWDGEYFASDYFDQLYMWAEQLIIKGKAYVCELNSEQVAMTKGTPTVAGKASPFRDRLPEENLDLFRKMKIGEFAEGTRTLRAKIDMASPNMHMRDPILYRIINTNHHRTGDKWCIYPMYDFAHGQSDYIEGISHSICTLEFEVHRPLYEWFLTALELPKPRPRQIEFARLNINYTVMSKRKLLQLVKENLVNGWDDPRMPTICGLRRRGYTPESIRQFAERIGVAKRENTIDVGLLEFCIREDLNKRAPRVMGVINPIKLIITNYPEDKCEELDAINNPEDNNAGTRKISFSKELWIERDDFMENPSKKYFRLAPGNEVRLRYAYFVKCVDFKKDADGNICEIYCTYDPESRGGTSPDGRKVKGTIHWISAKHAIKAEMRLYDRLFINESPDDVEEGKDWKDNINKESLKTTYGYVEESLAKANHLSFFQFERIGYFNVDYDSKPNNLIFNKTVGLKDSWTKIANKE